MTSAQTRRFDAARLIIVFTLAVCLLLVAFHAPLRALYWAERLARSADYSVRARYLTALCNAGFAARWGVDRLLRDAAVDIRQMGVVVLQHAEGDWTVPRLLGALGDPAPDVHELAALALGIQADDSLIPTLTQLYSSGSVTAGAAASRALGALGTPAAWEALASLAQAGPEDERRCALVEVLAEGPSAPCQAALARLQDDETPCLEPTRAHRLTAEALVSLRAAGFENASTQHATQEGLTVGARARSVLRSER